MLATLAGHCSLCLFVWLFFFCDKCASFPSFLRFLPGHPSLPRSPSPPLPRVPTLTLSISSIHRQRPRPISRPAHPPTHPAPHTSRLHSDSRTLARKLASTRILADFRSPCTCHYIICTATTQTHTAKGSRNTLSPQSTMPGFVVWFCIARRHMVASALRHLLRQVRSSIFGQSSEWSHPTAIGTVLTDVTIRLTADLPAMAAAHAWASEPRSSKSRAGNTVASRRALPTCLARPDPLARFCGCIDVCK